MHPQIPVNMIRYWNVWSAGMHSYSKTPLANDAFVSIEYQSWICNHLELYVFAQVKRMKHDANIIA